MCIVWNICLNAMRKSQNALNWFSMEVSMMLVILLYIKGTDTDISSSARKRRVSSFHTRHLVSVCSLSHDDSCSNKDMINNNCNPDNRTLWLRYQIQLYFKTTAVVWVTGCFNDGVSSAGKRRSVFFVTTLLTNGLWYQSARVNISRVWRQCDRDLMLLLRVEHSRLQSQRE